MQSILLTCYVTRLLMSSPYTIKVAKKTEWVTSYELWDYDKTAIMFCKAAMWPYQL